MTQSTKTVRLAPVRDGRLFAYAVIAVGGFSMALITGQPAVAALAAVFAIALAVGLRRTGEVEVRVEASIDPTQVMEGDSIRVRVAMTWDGVFDARVRLHRLTGIVLDAGSETEWIEVDAEGGLDISIDATARRWGRHRIAEVWLRLERPGALVSWTGKVLVGPALRVLPGAETLRRLLDPAESRAVWGMHRSSRLGDGHEFAELRPYQPGDRLRDLNWAATARRGRPFVNRHHPDLSGDVIIALDAFEDGSESAREILSNAARAAWSLASVHLKGNDRVGLVGFGGSLRWLPPAGGRRAQYQILESLLRIGADATDSASGFYIPRGFPIPGSALVIAITPLQDPRLIEILSSWRARGRAVSVLAIDAMGTLPEADTPSAQLARRVWALSLEQRQLALERVGIPVVSVPADGATAPAIAALARARRAPTVRRGA